MASRNLAIISIIGRDQKGVVARVSTSLASCNTNIEDIEQRVMDGLFVMTMQVDLTDLNTTLDELVLGLRRIGEEIGMEVTIRLAGDLVVVLSNHPDLEPLARAHGLPFRWSPSTDKAAHEDFLLAQLAEYRVDLVGLARYMQTLSKRVIDRYPSRITHIHPSLLPYHPGPN